MYEVLNPVDVVMSAGGALCCALELQSSKTKEYKRIP